MTLQPWSLFWVSLALFSSAGISVCLGLGLAQSLMISGVRSALQLSALGVLLTWIYGQDRPFLTIMILIVMTASAVQVVSGRVSSPRNLKTAIHVFISLVGGTGLTSFLAIHFVLLTGTWQRAEVLLPFVGLLLGNSLTGISLGMTHWNRALREQQGWIETRLAHGATPWEAIQPIFRNAISTSMTPILNSMSVAGIVSLPGMMTGQLLAGISPSTAVQYQIAALFLISASTFLGTLIALGLGYRSILNPGHQAYVTA